MKSLLFIFSLGITTVFSSASFAGQSFIPPKLNGRVVHQCATGPWFSKGSRCKIPAQQFVADHFCKEKGFSYVAKFKADNNPNRTEVSALRIRDGNISWEDRYYFGVFIQIDCR